MPRISAAQRRRELVEAAVEVIAAHGIDGATTRRIADQAQANLAMLHYCYDSKEDLFADVYQLVYDRLCAVLTEGDYELNLADTARSALVGLMECYFESESFTATAVELISWAKRQHQDRGIAVSDQATGVLRGRLLEATDIDAWPSSVVDHLAAIIVMLSDGFAIGWLTYGDPDAARDQMRIATGLLDSWLSTNPPARRRKNLRANSTTLRR